MRFQGRIGRTIAAAALLGAVAGAPSPARAHFLLVAPDSWMSQGPYGDPQKVGPCGEEGGGTATGKVTTFRPGQTIEVTVDEKIFHPGHYRVALAVEDRSELPAEPAVTAVGSDPCGSVEIQDPPIFPILADELLPHTEPFNGPQTFAVELPGDVTCTRCTLQIIEYMAHHGRPCFYHHCADISIQGDLETPVPASTPTPTFTPTQTTAPIAPTATNTAATAPTPTATPGPPASCAGDCDGSGSVTLEELVTLVAISLHSMPIEACRAGDTDGDQKIALNEIVAAVNSALTGCTPPGIRASER
jgi:hypothetical protein